MPLANTVSTKNHARTGAPFSNIERVSVGGMVSPKKGVSRGHAQRTDQVLTDHQEFRRAGIPFPSVAYRDTPPVIRALPRGNPLLSDFPSGSRTRETRPTAATRSRPSRLLGRPPGDPRHGRHEAQRRWERSFRLSTPQNCGY